MIPGNADPKRPDKVQRLTGSTIHANGQEDLVPDYLNILGQQARTVNATMGTAPRSSANIIATHTADPVLLLPATLGDNKGAILDQQQQTVLLKVATTPNVTASSIENTTAVNLIPTNSTYGVAIIPTNISTEDNGTIGNNGPTIDHADLQSVKPDENKDLNSTPSRNDRFKVVKIASLEPFKRGRWKCMDYVDEVRPSGGQQQPQTISQQQQQAPTKATQSTGSLQMGVGGLFLQTQSLPQQQIQQMLLQGGQFFPNVQGQLVQQAQYICPHQTVGATTICNGQSLNNTASVNLSAAQLINTNPQYILTAAPTTSQATTSGGIAATGAAATNNYIIPNAMTSFTVTPNFQNIQYIPSNLIQTQQSTQTFQLPVNLHGANQTLHARHLQQQSLANGYSTSSAANNLPSAQTDTSTYTKSSSVTSTNTTTTTSNAVKNVQPQINQIFNNSIPSGHTQTNVGDMVPNIITDANTQLENGTQIVPNIEGQTPEDIANGAQTSSTLEDDIILNDNEVLKNTNTSSAVNAIDNKIEQAMDLVKSHLMYTVREEVEVLKEKIAELMDKIQQLENENSYLRSQIPNLQTTTKPNTQPSIGVTTTTSKPPGDSVESNAPSISNDSLQPPTTPQQ